MINAFTRRYGGACTFPGCGIVRDYHRYVVGHEYTRAMPGAGIASGTGVAAQSFDDHPQRRRDLAAERPAAEVTGHNRRHQKGA